MKVLVAVLLLSFVVGGTPLRRVIARRPWILIVASGIVSVAFMSGRFTT